ncbi:hypothetical protein IEQ34_002582 [Dendrobium chrysotoxum]|uniref:Bifunctional inhibitor/plant lipid transfer protein/seed storage helical domain-containing protein n=1 Tax=Dendrobium chrysotoxum TaxID=161865 RepID=A0AAV7H197_DENCH|nr:hypothetical protein IEQ34_002582 [Dendrobium chrysotoxum]
MWEYFCRYNGLSNGSMCFGFAGCECCSFSIMLLGSSKIGQNPKCLCAVMLSNTAKSAGVNPGVAVTIPKRCEISNRPVGYKSGGELAFYWFDVMNNLLLILMFRCACIIDCRLYFALKVDYIWFIV